MRSGAPTGAAMSKQDNNSIPELVELSSRMETNPGGPESELKIELRVHPASVDGPHDLTFSASLTRLVLSLDLVGLSVVPGSRFGEPTRKNEAIFEMTISKENGAEQKRAGEIGASASILRAVSVSTRQTDSQGRTSKETIAQSETKHHHRVCALGNLNWEVTQPPWETQILDLTYMNDETLCKVRTRDRANQKSLVLRAFARQRDVSCDAEKAGFPFLRTPTQKKLMNILLSKALASDGNFNGTLTFSCSVIEFED